jgi:antagonist of KipI
MAVVHVTRPGLLTTVQDHGRWGFQALGVSVAGPMDHVSHRLANAMVANPAGAATIEITLVGPELVFEDERLVCVAGAEYEVALDGEPVPATGTFVVKAGTTLRFGRRIHGTRAYLAVSGGFDTPPVLGSRATHLPSAMGGLAGRALVAGDRLPCGPALKRPTQAALAGPFLDLGLGAVPEGTATLRVLPGPQSDHFTGGALDALQSAPYRIAPSSNRMGFRLDGPLLTHARGANTISDATPLGTLQVPASGQPILLMADRPTSGGYPKLATVITADIGLAGQLGPGDTIAFSLCSRGEALAALIGQERRLTAIEAVLR